MKNLFIPLCLIFSLALMNSCGGGAKDINVEDIETACECADAFLLITEENLDLVEANLDDFKKSDLSDDVKKELEALGKKQKEVQEHCKELGNGEREFWDEIKACEAYEKSKDIQGKITAKIQGE
jgi:hypothetical protein